MPRASRGSWQSRRSTYHHGDLRRALIDATLEIIAQQGGDKLTLRAVARRAGVSHAAPYRHFRDKDALLAAVVEEGFVELHERMIAAALEGTSPRDRLRRYGLAYVAFALERQGQFRFMLGGEFARLEWANVEAAAHRTLLGLVERIEACQRAGVVRGGDALALARIGWAVMHGIAELATRGQVVANDRQQVLQWADDALSVYLDGVAAKRSGPRTTAALAQIGPSLPHA